jgi:hypothetical protein
MSFSSLKPRRLVQLGTALLLLTIPAMLFGQTCLTASDMDDAIKTALVNTAQTYFQMVAAGDAATLKQNAIQG